MPYSVAQAIVTIPGSVSRLLKQGYSQVILMQDVWPLTVPETQAQIAANSTNTSNTDPIPIVFLTLVKDDIV